VLVYTVATGSRGVMDLILSAENELDSPLYRQAMTADTDFVHFCDGWACPSLCEESRFSQPGKSIWRPVFLSQWDVPVLRKAKMKDSFGVDHFLSRAVKLVPHRMPLLASYSTTIYIDANVAVLRPVTHLLRTWVGAGVDVATWYYQRPNHTEWRSMTRILKNRGDRVFGRKKYEMEINRWVAQRERYAAQFGQRLINTTAYGKIVIRANNTRSAAFNDCWWREFSGGIARDQVSLYFCMLETASMTGLSYKLMRHPTHNVSTKPFHDPVFTHYFLHLGQQDAEVTKEIMSNVTSGLYSVRGY